MHSLSKLFKCKGQHLVSLRRIGTKLGGNYSYKPPAASYTAPGPYILQGNGKMRERHLYKLSKCFPLYSLIFPLK